MLSQALIRELTHEGANTRKMLERVPFDNPGWKPHEKSMTLGRLASHVAENYHWVSRAANAPEFVFDENYRGNNVGSSEELLALLDRTLQTAIDDLGKVSDEAMMESWSLKRGDHVIFSLPRIAAIRSVAMNHNIHHRGQLSVYLRLLGVAVPGMYGPSADELMP